MQLIVAVRRRSRLVQMATLQMIIDSRKAKSGAAEFNRAADSMKRKAANAMKGINSDVRGVMRTIGTFAGVGGATYFFHRITKEMGNRSRVF